MTNLESSILNGLIQKKFKPIAFNLSYDGIVESESIELWFMQNTKLKKGDSFFDICPYFFGLDLSKPAYLPIIELPDSIAIEIELVPKNNVCIVIIMDATTQLNAIRMQQQLTNELKLANTKLEQLSRKDALTGLYNRGYWQEQLELEYNRCQRYQHISSLIMLDIDHFKKINDNFGHPAGDLVIKRLAFILRNCSRKTDVVGRYGGEEFALILPNTDSNTALSLAERIRMECVKELLTFSDKQQTGFTISIGIAEINEAFKNSQDWLNTADQALYHAKENGRNRSVQVDRINQALK